LRSICAARVGGSSSMGFEEAVGGGTSRRSCQSRGPHGPPSETISGGGTCSSAPTDDAVSPATHNGRLIADNVPSENIGEKSGDERPSRSSRHLRTASIEKTGKSDAAWATRATVSPGLLYSAEPSPKLFRTVPIVFMLFGVMPPTGATRNVFGQARHQRND